MKRHQCVCCTPFSKALYTENTRIRLYQNQGVDVRVLYVRLCEYPLACTLDANMHTAPGTLSVLYFAKYVRLYLRSVHCSHTHPTVDFAVVHYSFLRVRRLISCKPCKVLYFTLSTYSDVRDVISRKVLDRPTNKCQLEDTRIACDAALASVTGRT